MNVLIAIGGGFVSAAIIGTFLEMRGNSKMLKRIEEQLRIIAAANGMKW